MSNEPHAELQRIQGELKKANNALQEHKRNAKGGGAEWRGNWDTGHWFGHNSTDLNRTYRSLYNKVAKAHEQVESVMYMIDPYRRDLDTTIQDLKVQRKRADADYKCKPYFDPIFDKLVMVISRKINYEKGTSNKYVESLCVCNHYFQGRKVPCDCIPDEIGFLSLSDANEERLKNKRVCFVGDSVGSVINDGKPVRGPTKPGKGLLRIARNWKKECNKLIQVCVHYHIQPSDWEDEPKHMVVCDCIKEKGFKRINPINNYIKNDYYLLDSRMPITISRNYLVNGVSSQGSDTFGFECRHNFNIKDCTLDEFSKQCDCNASGELSEKLQKFETCGLVEKKFYGSKLNSMANIIITRETRGLLPHPQGHRCRHEREDGYNMVCDCIPLFNKDTVENFEDVVYELSEDMKKRQAAGRVKLAYDGKLQIGGFYRHVFFPNSDINSYTPKKQTPYDDDKYIVLPL